jgi:hypothetical protein
MTKMLKKVFNWSEVHLFEMTCYKIHTLVSEFPFDDNERAHRHKISFTFSTFNVMLHRSLMHKSLYSKSVRPIIRIQRERRLKKGTKLRLGRILAGNKLRFKDRIQKKLDLILSIQVKLLRQTLRPRLINGSEKIA